MHRCFFTVVQISTVLTVPFLARMAMNVLWAKSAMQARIAMNLFIVELLFSWRTILVRIHALMAVMDHVLMACFVMRKPLVMIGLIPNQKVSSI